MNDLQIMVRNEILRVGAKAPYVCLLCGSSSARTMKFGAYIPQDTETKASVLARGTITVLLYSCCPFCEKNITKAISAKLSTPEGARRVTRIEIAVPKLALINLKTKETIQ